MYCSNALQIGNKHNKTLALVPDLLLRPCWLVCWPKRRVFVWFVTCLAAGVQAPYIQHGTLTLQQPWSTGLAQIPAHNEHSYWTRPAIEHNGQIDQAQSPAHWAQLLNTTSYWTKRANRPSTEPSALRTAIEHDQLLNITHQKTKNRAQHTVSTAIEHEQLLNITRK